MKKIFLFTSILMISVAYKGFADEGRNANHNPEVSAYINSHIKPVILAKRKAFDRLLTDTEKNLLAEYREQLSDLRSNYRSLVRSNESGNLAVQPPMVATDEDRTYYHEKVAEIMEKVRVIADKHYEELNKIKNDLQPQGIIWKEEISKIIKSSASNEQTAVSSTNNNRSNFNFFGRRLMHWNSAAFLLLNPLKDDGQTTERGEAVTDPLMGLQTEEMNVYPNPAAEEFTINLNGFPAENKLVISDLTGKVVINKVNVLSTESFSCSELNNGIYFIQLSAGDQTINKKIIINH